MGILDALADTEEEQSFTQEAADFISEGLPGAAVSAGVSITNTAIALGNVFGAELEEVDTYETLQSFGMDQSAAYYKENPELVDGIGFVAGSFIPGMGGVKALRSWQTGIKAGKSLNQGGRWATGLRKAVAPDTSIAPIKAAIRQRGTDAFSTLQAEKLSVYAKGFHQQALEAAAFEGAVLLTMNQSPTINSQDLDYFDAMVANAGHAAFGIALGGGIGGALEGFASFGKMNRFIAGKEIDEIKIGRVLDEGDLAVPTGDLVATPFESYKNLQDMVPEGLDPGAKSKLSTAISRAEVTTRKRLQDFTNGNVPLENQLWTVLKELDTKQAGELLNGMKKGSNWRDADSIFEVPAADVQHMLKEDAKKYFKDRNSKDILEAIESPSTLGFAVTNVDINKGVSFTQEKTRDWDNIFTWRHESGHVIADYLSPSIAKKSKLGTRLQEQATRLSMVARARSWAQVSDEAIAKVAHNPQLQTELRQQKKYLQDGKELMADSWAMFNDPRTAKLARTEAPDMYNLFIGNKSLDAEYNYTKTVLDLNNGNVVSKNITPTAVDISGDIKVGKKFVEYGRGLENKVSLGMKYSMDNIQNLDPVEVNAVFSAAKTRTDIKEGMDIQWDDLPRLTAAYVQKVPVVVKKDGVGFPVADMQQHLLNVKDEIGAKLLQDTDPTSAQLLSIHTPSAISRFIDTGEEYIQRLGIGTQAPERIKAARDIPFYSARDDINVLTPNHMVLHADRRAMASTSESILRGEADRVARAHAERRITETRVAGYMGEDYKQLPDSAHQIAGEAIFTEGLTQADRSSGLVSAVQSESFSAKERVQQIGTVNHKVNLRKRQLIDDTFESDVQKIIADDDAMMEGAVLDSILRQDNYEFAPGTMGEFMEDVARSGKEVVPEQLEAFLGYGLLESFFKWGDNIWSEKLRDDVFTVLTKKLSEDKLDTMLANIFKLSEKKVHTIKNPNLAGFWRKKIDFNGNEIVAHKNQISAARGGSGSLNPNRLYPGRIDTKRYPYFAMVKHKGDELASSKDVSMITAHSEASLHQKVARAKTGFTDPTTGEPTIEVFFKKNLKEFKELQGDYESQLLFRDNMMDSALHNKGVAHDVVPEPSPEMFTHYLSDMKTEMTGITRNMTRLKYGQELAALKQKSDAADLFNSTMGLSGSKAVNPYEEMERLMLGVSAKDKYELWDKVNEFTDKHFSKFIDTAKGIAHEANKTGDWEAMNSHLKSYGMHEVYSETNQLVLNNIKASEPVMQKLVSKMNSFISTTMLRLDATQSIVNATSLPIMLVPEIKAMVKSAQKDRIQILKNGTEVLIPGSGKSISSPGKLMYQAAKDFWGRPDLRKRYKAMGHLRSVTDELHDVVEGVSNIPNLKGTAAQNLKAAEEALSKAADFGAKMTLADSSEEFVKFIAARTADMIGETLQVSPRMREASINGFVTRVHGNYIANQRPAAFQGWAGQAIGLFQTYQFNLLQGLMRNVADKNRGAAASMLGLQAGIFGAQSLPGFQYLNEYIGERSLENRDFYSTVNNALGDTLGNWLLYGTASSLTVPITGTGIDLYSRGDLTPRSPILVPTSLSEIPAIAFTGKFFSNIHKVIEKTSAGAPVAGTALDVLAHNGFNRPLAGITQMAIGERTTNKGSLLTTYQAMDGWTFLTKALGTKPLDEAIAVSSLYRSQAYKSYRTEQLQSLGMAVKESIYKGDLDDEAYWEFGKEYHKRGGTSDQFNQFMARQYDSATTSQINKLRRNNNSPEGRYLQEVLGAEVEDHSNTFTGTLHTYVDPEDGLL